MYTFRTIVNNLGNQIGYNDRLERVDKGAEQLVTFYTDGMVEIQYMDRDEEITKPSLLDWATQIKQYNGNRKFYYIVYSDAEKLNIIEHIKIANSTDAVELSINREYAEQIGIDSDMYKLMYIQKVGLFVLIDKLSLSEYIGIESEITELLKITKEQFYQLVNGYTKIDTSINLTNDVINIVHTDETVKSQKEPEESIEEYEEILKDSIDITWPKNTSGKDIIYDILKVLKLKGAIILEGPPGTGKTKMAEEIARLHFNELAPDGQKFTTKYFYEIQFSQEYSYSDFVDGLRPDKETGKWEMVDGIFKHVCTMAKQDNEHPYIIVIDEINRANTEQVIGEMLNLMEKRGKSIITKNGSLLQMPSNVYIIATMNTVDRGAGKLDFATISRFAEFKIPAVNMGQEEIDKLLESKGIEKLDSAAVIRLKSMVEMTLACINKINQMITDDNTADIDTAGLNIGMRSLYTNYKNTEEFMLVVKYDLKPEIMSRKQRLSYDGFKNIEEAINKLISDLQGYV